MLLTTTATTTGLQPDEHGRLVVRPTMAASVAATVSTIVTTNSHRYRIPIVATDPVAAWVAEGAEIGPSDPVIEELIVVPAKVAGLTIISSELADDTDPAAAQVVGDGLARDLAKRIDLAFFGAQAGAAPTGLPGLAGFQTVVAASAFTNMDAFAEAISLAETVGAKITAFVVAPATALALAKLRTQTGSNQPLLSATAADPTGRQILGVPVFVSSAVAANVAWALDSSRCCLVVRSDTTLEVDRSAYFSSDRVGVRAIMRVGFAFPHAASVVKISTA